MITVITAVYNAENYLRKSIESVILQSYKDFEYILVDDGSTDSSLKIIQEYAKQDNRIKYYTLQNSGNPKIPRDYAYKKSIGKFIIWIDADDYISSDFLEDNYNKIVHYDADMCAAICKRTNDNNEIYPFLPTKNFNRVKTYEGKELFHLMMLNHQIHMCGTLMKRSLLSEQFPSNVLYIVSDELDFRLHVLNSKKIVYSNAIYYYRVNSESITKPSIRLYDVIKADISWGEYLKKNYPHEIKMISIWNARCFKVIVGFIYLYYYQLRKHLTKVERSYIKSLLYTSYKTIKKELCRKYLSPQFHIISYLNYHIISIIIRSYCNILHFCKK